MYCLECGMRIIQMSHAPIRLRPAHSSIVCGEFPIPKFQLWYFVIVLPQKKSLLKTSKFDKLLKSLRNEEGYRSTNSPIYNFYLVIFKRIVQKHNSFSAHKFTEIEDMQESRQPTLSSICTKISQSTYSFFFLSIHKKKVSMNRTWWNCEFSDEAKPNPTGKGCPGRANFDKVKKGKFQSLIFKKTILTERWPGESLEPENHSGDKHQVELMHAVLYRTHARTWWNWESSSMSNLRHLFSFSQLNEHVSCSTFQVFIFSSMSNLRHLFSFSQLNEHVSCSTFQVLTFSSMSNLRHLFSFSQLNVLSIGDLSKNEKATDKSCKE